MRATLNPVGLLRGPITSPFAVALGAASAAVLALTLLSPQTAAAQEVTSSSASQRLTAPVLQSLRQLQEQWLQWMSAFYQGNMEQSEASLQDLLRTAGELGMERLPDLSLGVVVTAVRTVQSSASEADFRRAHWALDMAERLDPGRPETAFARSTVARLEGDRVTAVLQHLLGFGRVPVLGLEGSVWLSNLLLWSLAAFLLSGALFVALQMGVKGGALYRDLAAMFERFLPLPAAHGFTVIVLVWPVFLPHGLLWILFYWSVLLWGYGTVSERWLLIAVWLVSGVGPVAVAELQSRAELALSPAHRLMENLSSRRLYGNLFKDLESLREALPDNGAVEELTADLHRNLGQWELARSSYEKVLEQEPDNSTASVNLGVYFLRRGDGANAVQYFELATTSEATAAAAHFNLSEAYSGSYQFDESRQALAQARAINSDAVDGWMQTAEPVTFDGGFQRRDEIRQALLEKWRGEGAGIVLGDLWREALSVPISLGALLLAMILHLARRQGGYSPPPGHLRRHPSALYRWGRVLLPGMASAEAGEGGKAFLAIWIPVAALLLPFLDVVGYRVGWGYDPGSQLAWSIAAFTLIVYFIVKLRGLFSQRIQLGTS